MQLSLTLVSNKILNSASYVVLKKTGKSRYVAFQKPISNVNQQVHVGNIRGDHDKLNCNNQD